MAREEKRVAIIGGDGIGPEVVAAAVQVLEAVILKENLPITLEEMDLGADRYLRDGVTITPEEKARLLNEFDGALLGAMGDSRVPNNVHARDILLGLRFDADLYINYRPCRLVDEALSPLKNPGPIDLDIFRENTEGLYVNLGGRFKVGTPHETAIQESLNTYHGVERIVRAAFDHARARGRTRVTMVDKANAMPHAGGLWRRVFAEVGAGFSDIQQDTMYVDAMAMDLVRRPVEYQVLVTSNLFGDILSDLAAQITGGLGLAPSANVNPGVWGLFEPVHGSAPDIAGKGEANPLAAVTCGALLLEHLGFGDAAGLINQGVKEALASGSTTADLGGQMSTSEVGAHIAMNLAGALAHQDR